MQDRPRGLLLFVRTLKCPLRPLAGDLARFYFGGIAPAERQVTKGYED